MKIIHKGYMKYFNSRKGAVELSLNLIIMLIIGLVVMGLVIGFVTNLIGNAQGQFITELDSQDEATLAEVQNCGDNLCVLPAPSIRVEQGGEAKVFFAVKAVAENISTNPGPLNAQGDSEDPESLITYNVFDASGEAGVDNDNSYNGEITISGPGFSANEGAIDSKMYTMQVDSSLPTGNYFIIFRYYDADSSGDVPDDDSFNQRDERRINMIVE